METSREKFLSDYGVKNFISYLKTYVERKSIPFKNDYISISDASFKYEWEGDDSYLKSFNNFKDWNRKINSAIKNENDDDLKSVFIEILKWGGVKRGNNKHLDKISGQTGSLINYVLTVRSILNGVEEGKPINIEPFKNKEIISTSGFSKIYAAIDPRYIIYDSRVAYAICSFIREYFRSQDSHFIPEELRLGHGGRSSTQDRDPNYETYNFPGYTSRYDLHFISMLKTKWILEELHPSSAGEDKVQNLWQLQSGLFMIGK